MSEPIYTCMTKATTAVGDQRMYGPRWVAARRGRLKVYDDRLECGDWRIDFDEIEDAVLFSFRSFFFRIPGYVLTVETPERTYHFGLGGWGRFWKGELPFGLRRETGRLGFSWFSIAVRVVLFGYVAYLLWQWFVDR